MYAIMVDYYMWDGEKEKDYIEPVYLGAIYPPKNIYVFDEEFSSRSFRWDNREEAEKYLTKHKFDKPACCYENARVVEV